MKSKNEPSFVGYFLTTSPISRATTSAVSTTTVSRSLGVNNIGDNNPDATTTCSNRIDVFLQPKIFKGVDVWILHFRLPKGRSAKENVGYLYFEQAIRRFHGLEIFPQHRGKKLMKPMFKFGLLFAEHLDQKSGDIMDIENDVCCKGPSSRSMTIYGASSSGRPGTRRAVSISSTISNKKPLLAKLYTDFGFVPVHMDFPFLLVGMTKKRDIITPKEEDVTMSAGGNAPSFKENNVPISDQNSCTLLEGAGAVMLEQNGATNCDERILVSQISDKLKQQGSIESKYRVFPLDSETADNPKWQFPKHLVRSQNIEVLDQDPRVDQDSRTDKSPRNPSIQLLYSGTEWIVECKILRQRAMESVSADCHFVDNLKTIVDKFRLV